HRVERRRSLGRGGRLCAARSVALERYGGSLCQAVDAARSSSGNPADHVECRARGAGPRQGESGESHADCKMSDDLDADHWERKNKRPGKRPAILYNAADACYEPTYAAKFPCFARFARCFSLRGGSLNRRAAVPPRMLCLAFSERNGRS